MPGDIVKCAGTCDHAVYASTELWRCCISFSLNDQAFAFTFFGFPQDRAMLRHVRQIRAMLVNPEYARNVIGRNAAPRGAGTQYEFVGRNPGVRC
jgi:hypothetical protein